MTEEFNYEEKSYIRERYTELRPYLHTFASCVYHGYLSTSLSETDHFVHFIGGSMQALVSHTSTGILYGMPEWDLENLANVISIYFNKLITPINLWHHKAENKLDDDKGSSYISILFHTTVLFKSAFLSVLSGYSMSSVYSQNNYKVISMAVVSAFSALTLLQYFQDVEEQIIESVKNNNYYRVDALVKYRISKDKLESIIDKLSENIKCQEIAERYCDHAISSAVKLIDIAIDRPSANKAIKLAVSLALSVGKHELITDEVLGKIIGDDAFNEIMNLSANHLNQNSIKSVIEALFPVGTPNRISDEPLAKIKGFSDFSEIIKTASKLDNKSFKEISKFESELEQNNHNIRASAIDLIYKISKTSGWSYMPSDENEVTALNNIARYLLKLDKLGLRYPEQVEKLEDAINNILYKCIDNNCMFKGVEALLRIGRANKISDDVLNKITDDESFSKIIDKISYSINMHESKKITDSLVELINKISKISGWSYMPSDENGVTALNNIVQYLLKLEKLGLRYPEQVEKLEDAINNMLYKCIDNNCLFQGVETLLSSGKLKPISDVTISSIRHVDLYREILEKFIAYDESKSESNVIDQFASTILSNCGIKCIGHAMEVFHKSGNFKTQIEPFKSKFPITEIVNELLIKIGNEALKDRLESRTDTNAQLNEKLSLEEKILKYILSNVERGINGEMSKNPYCINEVKSYVHDLFYGENIALPSNLFNSLKEKIIYCKDLVEINSNQVDSVPSYNYSNTQFSLYTYSYKEGFIDDSQEENLYSDNPENFGHEV